MGKYKRSFSSEGSIDARCRFCLKARELQAAKILASEGHTVEFLPETGDGKHPDVLIDGIVADFKGVEAFDPDRVFELMQHARKQGADMAVIDLSFGSVVLEDAAEKAERAIDAGIAERGMVLLIDWHGRVTAV